jgi:hypothetical protein
VRVVAALPEAVRELPLGPVTVIAVAGDGEELGQRVDGFGHAADLKAVTDQGVQVRRKGSVIGAESDPDAVGLAVVPSHQSSTRARSAFR